jgi:hypothetical protein
MAERVGFEPTVRQRRTLDFESSAFDHSATFPDSVVLQYRKLQSGEVYQSLAQCGICIPHHAYRDLRPNPAKRMNGRDCYAQTERLFIVKA